MDSRGDAMTELRKIIRNKTKKDFNEYVDFIKTYLKEDDKKKAESLEKGRDYILNNWKETQIYLKNPYIKCSMESHISHILADLFPARPKAYSKNGSKKLLKLRLLKVNKVNIRQLYLNQLIKPPTKKQVNLIKTNANKIIFPTDTKTNKHLNNFYNTGLAQFDYIQKEISYL